MDLPLSQITSMLPVELDLPSMLKFVLFLAAGALVVALLSRLIFGRRSAWNHAISSAMGILIIYVVTVAVYTFQPGNLSSYLSPLPFIQFSGSNLYFLSFRDAGIDTLCENILSLLILAFLVNAIDCLIPRGKRIFGWYLLRFLSVAVAIGLHYAVNLAAHTFLPGVLVTYAPIILIGILLAMFLLGVLNVLLSLLLIAVNPILGGIYAFFFSNILGKQLTKSMLTTVLICALFFALSCLDISVVCISADALVAYIPLLIVLLVLWYLIGHLL